MKKAGLLLSVLAQLVVIIGVWAWYHVHHLMGNQLTGDLMGKLLAWGRLAGLLAAFTVLMQLMLVGRVKWIEKVLGLDRLTRLHHLIGFCLIFFLITHAVLVTVGHSMQAGTGPAPQVADFWRNWEDLPGAILGLSIMMGAILISFLIIARRISYESWYFTHLFLYLAIALSFGHQISVGSDFTDNKWFKFYWYAVYAFVFFNLILYRFISPVRAYLRHRFRVTELVPEADDVTSVHIGGKGLDKYPAKAGQFLIVRFLTKGFRWEAHPFSISCLPDGKRLRLTIKQLGDFTRKVPRLQPGTPLLIDGPHGIFTAGSAHANKVLMIAGGIGITPIRSVAEEMAAEGKDIMLIFGNRNSKAIVFKKELDDLSASSNGRFKVVHVMSDEPSWQGEKGRIDQERLSRIVPDILEREIFLCGPPVMMKAIRGILSEMGVSSSRIHFERFAL
jgi:predicted ferric reductase